MKKSPILAALLVAPAVFATPGDASTLMTRIEQNMTGLVYEVTFLKNLVLNSQDSPAMTGTLIEKTIFPYLFKL